MKRQTWPPKYSDGTAQSDIMEMRILTGYVMNSNNSIACLFLIIKMNLAGNVYAAVSPQLTRA